MNKSKVLLFWSGGKKSNLCFTKLKQSSDYEITAIVSLINPKSNYIQYHGIPETLIVEQSKLLNIPLVRVYVEPDISEVDFFNNLEQKLKLFFQKGIQHLAFGCTKEAGSFKVHQNLCHHLKVNALFPLEQCLEKELIQEYFELNHQAIITGVNKNLLDNSYLAKLYDQSWIEKLPENISPFSLKGEFHTFATFSPYFKMRIPFSKTIAIDEGPYTVSLLKEP